MKLKLIGKRKEKADVTSFVFEPLEKFSWQAGQYLFYTLPHENPDNRGITRYFTNSSAPSEKTVTISTRISDKPSTFKKTLNSLEIGAEIEGSGPDGQFVVDSDLIGANDPKRNMIFIAGGIGITPFRSILVDLESKNIKPNITLLYANHDENIVFRETLEELKTSNPNLNIEYIISPAHIDEKVINRQLSIINGQLFYVSGPAPFVRIIRDTIKAQGVTKENIKLDSFPGYS